MPRESYTKAPYRQGELPRERVARLNARSGEQSKLYNIQIGRVDRAEERIAFLTAWMKRLSSDDPHDQHVYQGLQRELKSAELFLQNANDRLLHAMRKRADIGRRIQSSS